MKKLLFLALSGVIGWFCFYEPPAAWRGIPAAKDPLQTAANLPGPFVQDGYTITPLAAYKVTAVVLSRDRYRLDRGAEIAPLDLALGWGPMSMASVINELSFSQSGRWYEYKCAGEPPLDPGAMSTHSANTHCIPATAEIRKMLLEIKRHELVTLEGFLVQVAGTDGFHWRSSLTRDDTGGGACELLWVSSVNSKRL